VTLAAVTIDGLQPFQISLNVATPFALDFDFVGRDRLNDLIDLLRTQFIGPQIGIDVGLLQNLARGAEANPVNIGQGRLDAFVRWNFNSE
jgi:hypothetical protein